MNDTDLEPTLCSPDCEKTCFACCPPIRPAGYEHVQYETIVKRMLRENTLAFVGTGKTVYPITGFSCWALGYLDQGYQRIGCLLHPRQNGEVDLRHRVGFGEKCRRESCSESKVFLELDSDERRFWLGLSEGMDSFHYSSRRINPIFRMMGWGVSILRLIALREKGRRLGRESFFQCYPFFQTRVDPRANAYLLYGIVKEDRPDLLNTEFFKNAFEAFTEHVASQVRHESAQMPAGTHTHLLDLDPYFLDFLRLSVGVSRADKKEAKRLKKITDYSIQTFRDRFQPIPTCPPC